MFIYIVCGLSLIFLSVQAMDSNRAFISAVKAGDTQRVEELIDMGADLNAQDKASGKSALMWAMSTNHPEIVELLLHAQADVNARDKMGETALVHVAFSGYKDRALMLINAGADINARTNNGRTALMTAAMRGDKGMIKLLLKHRAGAHESGWTALRCAVMLGHEDIVALLLKAGVDATQKNSKNETVLDSAKNIFMNAAFLDKRERYKKIGRMLFKAFIEQKMQLVKAIKAAIRESKKAELREVMSKAGMPSDVINYAESFIT